MVKDKKSIIDIKDLRRRYTIHHVVPETQEEIYFCKCGKRITKEDVPSKFEEFTVQIDEKKGYYDDLDVVDSIQGTSIVCKKCNTDYSKYSNFQLIKPSNSYFYGSFKFENTKDRIILNRAKVQATSNENSKYPTYKEVYTYIAIEKDSKKIFFKGYNQKKEVEYNLDSIVKIVNKFYSHEDLSIIDNLVEVHRFLNYLAGIVVDSKNMDLVDGLMSQMVGKPGMDVLMKITTIFLGIICYSNLSTIALTKGVVFLYDMMSNCNLPNTQTLSDNEVTSPIKIFNFLVSIENEEAQKEIESEKTTKEGNFLYKSKNGRSLNIEFDLNRFGFSENKLKVGSGTINVREDLKNQKVSKYIFNNINKFEDYKKLIRFTKFIKYEELIVLVMKYDIDFLVNLFEIIEFRDDVNMESLKQIIPLTMDYLKQRAVKSVFQPLQLSLREQLTGENEQKIEEINIIENEEKLKLNFSFLQQFSFYEYDDCVRMIEELKWEKARDFDKIRTVQELRVYHDKLVEHYNMLSDKEKYDKFKKFAKKFEYLENYKDTLKVKVLSTPKMVLDAAQEMRNCAGSYVTRISQGKYILVMIWDTSKQKTKEEDNQFMMGLTVNVNGLEFEQLKANCNRLASDRQKKLVMTYLKNKDISFQEIRDLRIDKRKGKNKKNNEFDTFM